MNQRIRIITYNIHKGMNIFNLEYILNQIRSELRRKNADLVFLQEVRGAHTLFENQFEYLADQVWPHHAYGKNALYSDGHHGNSILSKTPFLKWENIDVSDHPLEQRGILHGTIQLSPERDSKNTLHAICLHFGLFERSRRYQTEKLCKHIHNNIPPDAPLIIAGDFNDWRENCSQYLEENLAVQEIFFTLNGDHARCVPSFFRFSKQIAFILET